MAVRTLVAVLLLPTLVASPRAIGQSDTSTAETRERSATRASVGTNDIRLSDMATDGDPDFFAENAAVAYNSTNHEYLVVWSGHDQGGAFSPPGGEVEIYGQRVDAATGGEIGLNDFRISAMGPAGNTSFAARGPSVAYNPTANEYLVVWTADDDAGALVNNEFEVYGQRLDAATAAEIGANDFRISDMGPDGDTRYFVQGAKVVYNANADEYLVVWRGEDDTAPLVDDEPEIFGQRLTAAGVEVGPNDFRISDMGPDGNTLFVGFTPDVAYNGTADEYLVVWAGNDDQAPVANEFEIYAQRLAGPSGVELGVNDFRISDMGPDGDLTFSGSEPAVAYNPVADEYLVVWHGDDDAGARVEGETEIHGQRLAGSTGTEVGPNDFRISDMGLDGDPQYDGFDAAVAFNAAANEYLVVWHADEVDGVLVEQEREIFAQRLAGGTGAELGTNDFRLSDMGPDGNRSFIGTQAHVAANPSAIQYLVVWHGEDDTGALVNEETEVYGQRVAAPPTSAVRSSALAPLDLNGDGRGDTIRYDLAAGGATIDSESGAFPVAGPVLVPAATPGWSAGWTTLLADDFDGNGQSDLFFYDPSTGDWFKGISDGAFGFTFHAGVWSPGWHVGTLDLNGDGLTDTLVYDPTTGAWFRCVSTGNGTAGFACSGGTWSPGWTIYPVRLDADALDDLVLYNDATGSWFRAVNTGSAWTFTGGTWSPAWTITPGDYDGDGLSDLFLYDLTNGAYFVALNTGGTWSFVGGTFSPGWTVRAGDIDGNGRTDLLLYNETTGTWFQSLADGAGGWAHTPGQWSPGWQVTLTEFSGDALVDVLVYNPTTGSYFQGINGGPGTYTFFGGTWSSGQTIIATSP